MAQAKKPTRAQIRKQKERDDSDRTEPVDETNVRDFVMARAAGALASLDQAKAAILEGLALFVDPGEDPKGKERTELFDAALEHASCAVRGLEMADEAMCDVDFEESEPWDDED